MFFASHFLWFCMVIDVVVWVDEENAKKILRLFSLYLFLMYLCHPNFSRFNALKIKSLLKGGC